ncbi:Fe-S cluster biogenesis protein NfuA, 4Fe-4S-binding domain [Saccharicrinis carchari]|uniref:Fe-S cluster biogenesis protein NfuA, 4Fe-4S-binding domain n=1 Tax=Saccharicrinis carchari TaxID=1168039 RepID=A0A521EKP7_SACCC|nr:NifU family protein [Saccharicrinis carchari]SMO84488.1 Fe-S cluster biogenesis protein NfuA, 4Fe-4S-binding domain [Saccharicrinis carchari]
MQKNSHIQTIEAALEEIRPYLKADGGDIALIDVSDDLVVKVEFMGACVDCPMNYQTLRNGVEKVIKTALPQVKKVVAIKE